MLFAATLFRSPTGATNAPRASMRRATIFGAPSGGGSTVIEGRVHPPPGACPTLKRSGVAPAPAEPRPPKASRG